YLRQCEMLLRKLLFIDAMALAPTLCSGPPASSRQRSFRARRYHEQDPENSETWRVTFRVTSGASAHPLRRAQARRSGQASTDARSPGLLREAPLIVSAQQAQSLPKLVEGKATSSIGRFCSTWPAAERFEALLRAFNDPAPYVKRLARLIGRKA